MNGGDPYVHDSVSCHRSCGYRGEYLPTPEGSRPDSPRSPALFRFEEPQAIYKWQRGQSLPSVDNLYALSALLQVPMNEIIISTSHIVSLEQQAVACCSGLFYVEISSGTVGMAEFQNRLDPYPPVTIGLPRPTGRLQPLREQATS